MRTNTPTLNLATRENRCDVKEEYSESETPDPKRSRTDQCENESASDAQESGSDLEPENELEPELEPESSSVQTSSTTESSSRRGKRKQACKFNNDWLTRRGHWLKYVPRKENFVRRFVAS